jgi:hypothetical protein
VKLPVASPSFSRTKFVGSLPSRYPSLRVDYMGSKRGHGLRTARDIAKNAIVVEYLGERLSKKERLARPTSSYMVLLEDGTCIDAKKYGSLARFVNHDCSRANA